MTKIVLLILLLAPSLLIAVPADSLNNATPKGQEQQAQANEYNMQEQVEKINERLEHWEDDVENNNIFVEKYLFWITIVVTIVTIGLGFITFRADRKAEKREIDVEKELKQLNQVHQRLIETEHRNELIRLRSRLLCINCTILRTDIDPSNADYFLVRHIVKEPVFGKVDRINFSGDLNLSVLTEKYDIVVFNSFDWDKERKEEVLKQIKVVYNVLHKEQGFLLCGSDLSYKERGDRDNQEVYSAFSNNLYSVYPNLMDLLKVRDLIYSKYL